MKAGQTLITLRYPERETALANQEVKIQQQRRILQRHQQEIVEAKEQIAADEIKLRPLVAGAREGAIAREQVYEQQDKLRETRATLRDAQADARTAALELEAFQLERKRIQQEVRDSIVTAPIDGVVLGVNVKNGDGVEFRTNLLTIGDPRQVLVKLQLSTLNATQVRPHQLARVSVISPDRQTFTGRIQSLYPQAIGEEEEEQSSGGGSKQSNQSSSSDRPAVPSIVLLDTPTRTLIPGSRVNVEILLQQRQNVIVLPTEIVQRDDDDDSEPFVWVRDSQGNAQKRPVKLGLEGLTLEQRYPGFSFWAWNNVDDLIQQQQTLELATRGLMVVGAIALLVGGVGIANITIASVTERTSEIGIRRAVGATQREIALQFVLEAALLSLASGTVALVVVHVVALNVADAFDLPYEFEGRIAALALGSALVVGVGAGFPPALRASQLDPVQALRSQ
ncbi:FtsX-like permease family protein [Chroococcidiopsis sp. CCALA 051]|uniref:FtsX-like permease family protein n=1 Tax=Chroococcidiopsis sp. CCALA 051 TaxID=869949 RepID=UPI0018ECC822